MLFQKGTYSCTLVQLQIIHFFDLQSTVPLTRGPSVTAEPLVYTYVSWDMPYISRVQNFKIQASCASTERKRRRGIIYAYINDAYQTQCNTNAHCTHERKSHDLDHYLHYFTICTFNVCETSQQQGVVQHYMEHEMYNLLVNVCLFSRYGRQFRPLRTSTTNHQ